MCSKFQFYFQHVNANYRPVAAFDKLCPVVIPNDEQLLQCEWHLIGTPFFIRRYINHTKCCKTALVIANGVSQSYSYTLCHSPLVGAQVNAQYTNVQHNVPP